MTVIWRWAMAYVHWLVIDTVTQPDVTALCCVNLGALPYRSGLYLLLQQQCFNGAYLLQRIPPSYWGRPPFWSNESLVGMSTGTPMAVAVTFKKNDTQHDGNTRDRLSSRQFR